MRGACVPPDPCVPPNLRAQVLLEEGDRAAPGQVGCLFVVARIVGVVVEGVLCTLVDVDLVGLAVGFNQPWSAPCY